MKKNKIAWVIFGAIISLLIGVFFYLKIDKVARNDFKKKILLGKCVFDVETVNDEAGRKNGLSNRDSLCQNCGMLFLFDRAGKHSFWMKDMRFPIDIIWIRDDKVIDINQNVDYRSKDSYSSKERINKVLELNANDIGRCGIKIGDIFKK